MEIPVRSRVAIQILAVTVLLGAAVQARGQETDPGRPPHAFEVGAAFDAVGAWSPYGAIGYYEHAGARDWSYTDSRGTLHSSHIPSQTHVSWPILPVVGGASSIRWLTVSACGSTRKDCSSRLPPE